MNGVKKTGAKLLGIAIVLVILLVIIKQPVTAGNAGSDIWTWLNGAANSLGNFVNTLFD